MAVLRTQNQLAHNNGLISENIPVSVEQTYKGKGWLDWKSFLGYSRIPNNRREYLEFEEAKKIVRKLGLSNSSDWWKYCKTHKPENIPSSPSTIYKESGWKGMADWLGTKNISTHNRQYLSFDNAREYVSKLGILSVKEWQTYTKINRPENIPTNPQRTYRYNGWKGWADFLGKE